MLPRTRNNMRIGNRHLHDWANARLSTGCAHLVNLYTDEIGNRAPPEKLKRFRELQNATTRTPTTTRHISWPAVGVAVLIIGALAIGILAIRSKPQGKPPGSGMPLIRREKYRHIFRLKISVVILTMRISLPVFTTRSSPAYRKLRT
mgnify:CR=1 FL=1